MKTPQPAAGSLADAYMEVMGENEQLKRENSRLKGRLRSVAAARTRLRRKLAQA